MKKLVLFILVLGSVCSSAFATEILAGKETAECGENKNVLRRWSYCIYRTEGSTNPDRLYYFHGRSEALSEWRSESLKDVRAAWGDHPPTVVSISFGKVWLLAGLNRSKRSGLFEYFNSNVFPEMEAKLGPLPEGARRLIVGKSMGGFNSLRVFFSHPELFDRAAFLCPAVGTISPFSQRKDIATYIKQTQSSQIDVLSVILTARLFFHDDAAWRVQDPLVMAVDSMRESTPPIFISVGEQDDYGFYPGAVIIRDTAIERGTKVTWAPVTGKHCVFNGAAAGKFLAAR